MNKLNRRIINIMQNTLSNSFYYWNPVKNYTEFSVPGSESEIKLVENDPISILIERYEFPDEDLESLKNIREKIFEGVKHPIDRASLSAKFRMRKKSDDTPSAFSWFKLVFYLKKDEAGLISEISIALRRMTGEEIMQKEILDSFSNDRNPRIFHSRILQLIEGMPDKKFAFVQFDVKDFKFLNAHYGDSFGDEVLNHLRNVLSFYGSETFIYSRLSSDIFMFVTTYEERQDIIDFISELDARLSTYKNHSFSICYGINFATDKTAPPRFNGDCAAMARLAAKKDATTKYKIFEDNLYNEQQERSVIEEEMKLGLGRHEFVMFLQPKYDIETKEVHGAEALVRWKKKDGSLVSPGQFIPIAEENGLIREIDFTIWRQASATISQWIKEGKKPVPISINVSRVHLDNYDFIQVLNDLIDEYQIPKHLLEIEITETLQNDNTESAILELKKNDFMLLMDDFGTGYSSLKMINDTPFDVLKIDRSFLTSFLTSERGQKIISHTIDMSKDIGLDLIAEGVENESQEAFLLENGCRYAQGFLYSRPIPVEEFNEKYIVSI